MSLLTKIKNRTKWLLSFPKDWIGRIVLRKPKVLGIEETITKIVNDKCSIARYGDGEFNIMFGNSIDFQTYNDRLAQKMKDILKTDDDKFLVGLTGEMYSKNENLLPQPKSYWKRFIRNNRWKLARLYKKNKVYYHASMTRFYMAYKDKANSKRYSDLLKEIWRNRDIVFVEGDKSRLGVGNDFFDNAKSIRRILCPANQAFDFYDKIVEEVKTNIEKDALILLALGPTATAMAYDLHVLGYQAVDIGHVDIEYEWMKMGATEKVAVKGKYVNEVEEGKMVGDTTNSEYLSQIIKKIGV